MSFFHDEIYFYLFRRPVTLLALRSCSTDKAKSDFLKFYLIKESSQCTKGFTILEIEIVQ